MRFDFTVSHVSGKNLMTADTLSRAPLGEEMLDSDEQHMQEELRKESDAYAEQFSFAYLPLTSDWKRFAQS